jgi:hypothetical protein
MLRETNDTRNAVNQHSFIRGMDRNNHKLEKLVEYWLNIQYKSPMDLYQLWL